MKVARIALLSALLGLAGFAFAASADYADTMKKVDAAIASGQHGPSTTDEAKRLRADAVRMMKEGKEAEAMKLLEQVKKLLNMK